jgi:hypothetical protein
VANLVPTSRSSLSLLPTAFLPSFLPLSLALQSMLSKCTNLKPIHSTTNNAMVSLPHHSQNIGRKRQEASGRPSSHLPQPLLLSTAFLPCSHWHCSPSSPNAPIPTHPFYNGQHDGVAPPPFPKHWMETARGEWQDQFPPPSAYATTYRLPS